MGASVTQPALSSQPAISSDHSSTMMKFLILAALVAVAAADYHDDTFHFSTVGGVSGLQKSYVQPSTAVVPKKYNNFQAYSNVDVPAYNAAPVLFKNVEDEIPAYSQQFAAKQFQPAYNQYAPLKEIAQPIYPQQYALPAFNQYKPAFEYKQPAFEYKQPAFEYKQAAKPIFAQPAFEYKQAAKPIFAQPAFEYKQAAKPVYSVKKIAEPVFTPYKQFEQPAFTQYSNLYPQQYSDSVSTYASNYNAPQYRILSHIQESDAAGPYRVSYSTENGIQATEQGSLVEGAEGAVVAAQGAYSFTAPDGKTYTVNYIADENGFRASGDHIPSSPAGEVVKAARSNQQYDNLYYKH